MQCLSLSFLYPHIQSAMELSLGFQCWVLVRIVPRTTVIVIVIMIQKECTRVHTSFLYYENTEEKEDEVIEN